MNQKILIISFRISVISINILEDLKKIRPFSTRIRINPVIFLNATSRFYKKTYVLVNIVLFIKIYLTDQSVSNNKSVFNSKYLKVFINSFKSQNKYESLSARVSTSTLMCRNNELRQFARLSCCDK